MRSRRYSLIQYTGTGSGFTKALGFWMTNFVVEYLAMIAPVIYLHGTPHKAIRVVELGTLIMTSEWGRCGRTFLEIWSLLYVSDSIGGILPLLCFSKSSKNYCAFRPLTQESELTIFQHRLHRPINIKYYSSELTITCCFPPQKPQAAVLELAQNSTELEF